MKVKSYYWDYLQKEDSYDQKMTESELQYHQQNMQYSKPLYSEIDYDLMDRIKKLRERLHK